MSTYSGKYSDDKSNSKSFDRDTSICTPRGAGEGKDAGARPQYEDYAGGRTARKPNIDPDLSYVNSSPGNRKEKSWR